MPKLKSENIPPKILWVDDQISQLQEYVQKLRNSGFQVKDISNFNDALSEGKSVPYNIIIVDLRLKSPNDGIELIRQLHQIETQKNAIFAVLSSYLYLGVYRKRLRQLDFRVQLIDKDFPNVNAEDINSRFIDPIKELSISGVTQTIQDQDKGNIEVSSDIDPFNIPLAEFMKKSIFEKDRLVDLAERKASKTINNAFKEGKIWVLLCGSKDIVRASASNISEILTEDAILEFARTQERPTFQFFSQASYDEVWLDCGSSDQLDYYPTLSIELKNEKQLIHFDTGAPITFFSYEELLRLEVISPTSTFSKSKRNNKEYRLINLNIEALLKCQDTDMKRTVRLRGQAVRDWDQSPFARYCHDKNCSFVKKHFDINDNGRPCPLHNGLIGRNILIENQLILILDGKKKKSKLGR